MPSLTMLFIALGARLQECPPMLTKREEHSPASMCTGGSRDSPRACEAVQQHQPHRASPPWNSPSPVPRGCQDGKEVKKRPLCMTLAVPGIFQSFYKHKCQSQFQSLGPHPCDIISSAPVPAAMGGGLALLPRQFSKKSLLKA